MKLKEQKFELEFEGIKDLLNNQDIHLGPPVKDYNLGIRMNRISPYRDWNKL